MVKIVEFHDMDIPAEIMPKPDYDVGQDLLTFMRNDPMFYRKHFFPAIDAVKSDPKKDTKPLKILIKKGLGDYCKKFDIKNPIEDLLDSMDSEEVINAIMIDELNEATLTAQPHLAGLEDPDAQHDDGELRVYTQAYRDLYKKAKDKQDKADARGGAGASYTTTIQDPNFSQNVRPTRNRPKKPRT